MSANYFNRIRNTDGSGTDGSATETGLDQLVNTLGTDFGLTGSISSEDLIDGVSAAKGMNTIIVEAIQDVRGGTEGKLVFTVDDVVNLNKYIRETHLQTWTELYGTSENGEETGYQLLRNEGATSQYRGDNLADTVADSIYHLGFEIQEDGRILDGNGNPGATLQQVADWLTQFFNDQAITNTGLDRLSDMVMADSGLSQSIPDEEIAEGANFSGDMAEIISMAIEATGVGADNKLDAEDIGRINDFIHDNIGGVWSDVHGNDAEGQETGFHLVQNDGATTRIFGKNFVDTVLEGIHNLGFETPDDILRNENGEASASINDVADWLNYFYVDQSTTGTGLDYLVDAIKSDRGLSENTSARDINAGADAANEMNKIIAEAIQQTRINQDAPITVEDVRAINAYIQQHHLARWAELHGNDENGQETGFHLVHGDGGSIRYGGDELINTVAEGLYNLGFAIDGDHILDEGGNPKHQPGRPRHLAE